MPKPFALLTNDDGIDSLFLHKLRDGLLKKFDVHIVAPDREQSWIGMAISRHKSLHVNTIEDFPCPAHTLSGTPTDCVNIATYHLLPRKPDIVISGMNIHANVSMPLIFSSGTVGGAIEGATLGFPSLAVSHHIDSTDYRALSASHGHSATPELQQSLEKAADIATEKALEITQIGPEKMVFHNLNFPVNITSNSQIKSTRPCRLSLGQLFKRDSDSEFSFQYPVNFDWCESQNTDLATILEGNISFSRIDMSLIGQ